MKSKLILAALAVAFSSTAKAVTAEASTALVDAGQMRFSLYNLPGEVNTGLGIAHSLAIGHDFGSLRVGFEGQYINIPLNSVYVGPVEKHWGETIEGWYAGAFVSYEVAEVMGWHIRPRLSLGYQDVLGGATAYSVGLGVERKVGNWSVGVGVDYRACGSSTYEGIQIERDASVFYRLSINCRF